ncbi:MAG: Holliday junction branch migration protein RuvA [Capsulimonadaceae bacterium]
MFAHLSGTIARIEAGVVVIDVGGVGYRVAVPVSALSALPAVGGKALLHIHTHIRPEEISLYGFTSTDDRKVFEMLLGVTGIGPKVALSILSGIDAAALARTVAAEDTRTLVRIPGLGMKTAQRLVLELKDKLAAFAFEQRVDSQQAKAETKAGDFLDDVVEGLVGLGYNRNDARKAGERAVKEIVDKSNMADALRAALKLLLAGK